MSRHARWEEYADFCDNFPALKNFSPDEFLYLGGSNSDPTSRLYGLNWYPPKELWNHIYKLAEHVQKIRSAFGRPIFITSCFRNKEYNDGLPGAAPNSFHRRGMAADMQPLNGDTAHLGLTASRLTPKGGVGIYNTFVHVDIRGYKARW